MVKSKPGVSANDALLLVISDEIKRISKILTYLVIKSESQENQIKFLSSIGYMPKEIAEILNTSSNTVRVTLSKSKKKKTKRNRDN